MDVSGPLTSIDVAEYPRQGRAVLSFTARAAPGGQPVAFIEYRTGRGRWQRGDLVEVRRRGIFSRVTCRAVDAGGTAGPEQTWEKDWPGLYAAAYPEGTANWVSTYDWWKFRRHDRWWLDHPVCLVFRSPSGPAGHGRPLADALVARTERVLHRLGLRSHLFDWVRALGRASNGGLPVGVGASPDVFAPTVMTQGVKRRLRDETLPAALWHAARGRRSDGLQSSVHVRVYAPGQRCFHDPEHGSWAVGSCHLDINELMSVRDGRLRWGAGLPPGAPDPGIGADLVKYGGNSEWAAGLVADLWEEAFGRRRVARGAASLGKPQDWFQVLRSDTWHGRSWVMGKWWRSDGRLTVLDLPDE